VLIDCSGIAASAAAGALNGLTRGRIVTNIGTLSEPVDAPGGFANIVVNPDR
jgi:hypothetical protein